MASMDKSHNQDQLEAGLPTYRDEKTLLSQNFQATEAEPRTPRRRQLLKGHLLVIGLLTLLGLNLALVKYSWTLDEKYCRVLGNCNEKDHAVTHAVQHDIPAEAVHTIEETVQQDEQSLPNLARLEARQDDSNATSPSASAGNDAVTTPTSPVDTPTTTDSPANSPTTTGKLRCTLSGTMSSL